MSTARTLASIAVGYAAAFGIAAVAVWVRYLFADPADVAASSGMYAGGDLIGFVLVAGLLSLAPTFFLLRLATGLHPRATAGALLAVSATAGPALWITATAASKKLPLPEAVNEALGLALVFAVIPRVVAMPVMLAVEALALLLSGKRRARIMLACAMALEAAPLAAIVAHLAFARR